MWPDDAITDFHGEHYWLDNMYPCTIWWDSYLPDLKFKAVEYGFVYFKVADPELRKQVLECPDPYEAKAFGRSVPMRSDWDEIKFGIMYELVKKKFQQHQELRYKLQQTGNVMLIEGNDWDDNIWGDCICEDCRDIPGQNFLGKILMSLRVQYRAEFSR